MEFYTFAQSKPTMAILPIIWWAIIAAIIIIAKPTRIKGTSLGILGMQQSGKTLLLSTLQKKPYRTYEATLKDVDYDPFTVEINGRKLKFQKGIDIGGFEGNVSRYYEDFIKEKDAIFFIFDVKRYLSEAPYAQDVRNRLDFVHRKLKDHKGSDIKAKYLIIGSHLDQLSNSRQKTALKELKDSISGKSYEELFDNNILLCDLTDRSKILDFLENNIF